MEILKRKNPNAHRNNALQLSDTIDLCCGDKAAVVVCQYSLSVDSGDLASASKISLGGSEYSFAAAVALTATNAAVLLQEAINAAVYAAGYTSDDVAVSKSGDVLTITTSNSQLEFDYLQADTTPFLPVTCEAFGDFKTKDKAETKVAAYVDDTEVVVVFGALLGVTNVRVTGTSVTTYSEAPPANGVVRTATALAADASSTLTIVLTYADGTTASFTRTVTK